MAGESRLITMLLGAPNFRDLAGLRTRGGRTVAQGRLLRSGQLGDLHEEDIERLRLWLGADVCVIDLRGEAERAKHACALDYAVVHCLPIEPSVAQKLDAMVTSGQPLTVPVARGYMADAYRGFVRARTQVAALFEHAVAREGRPMVVHCAAGKDRTGFIVAMLLAALDVPRAAIMDDYLLTNQRIQVKENKRYPPEIMEVLGTVRAEFLEAAFEAIEADYGSLDAYLAQAAALTAEQRARLQQAVLNS